jgi:hypothetical protein
MAEDDEQSNTYNASELEYNHSELSRVASRVFRTGCEVGERMEKDGLWTGELRALPGLLL